MRPNNQFAGPLKRVFEAPSSICLALTLDALLGSNDGECQQSDKRIFFNITRLYFQTVQGLVHNYGGLLGERVPQSS